MLFTKSTFFFDTDYEKEDSWTFFGVNYQSFGMPMPGADRAYQSQKYRYGFNGQEKDDEVKGNGSSYDFGNRIYDPRLGRWYSIDRVVKPELSPYLFGSANPIIYVDSGGDDEFYFNIPYLQAKRRTLLDGKNAYSIPEYNRRVTKPVMNEYYFKTGETKQLNEAEPYSWDSEKQAPIENYTTKPTYIKINSPMTIKGGDASNNGFSNLTTADFTLARSLVESFAKTVKPSASISDPVKLLAIIGASGYNGLLDFKVKMGLDDNTLYQMNGIYYNKNEAGNYFYGYALAMMKFSEADVEFIAHQGTIMLSKGKRTFDEPWELDAIKDGFNAFFTENRACGDDQCESENIDMYTNPNK
jgi:RHS repeat-associated protein